MVVAARADPYTPFLHSHLAEDGVQSSEEGSSSDIHSPIFETPYPPEIRYHLGHPPLPDASSLASAFDARYHSPHAVDVQGPAHHLLETLQAPSASQVLLPSPPHAHYVLQHHPVLPVAAHVGLSPPLVSPPALSPVDGYAFDFSHRAMSGQHMRAAYEPSPSTSRAAFVLPVSEPKPPSSSSSRPSPSGKGNSSGSNAQPGPSRQRREASSVVIACRQCRGRKIRCDSTRPVCNNCTRRGNECEYDAKPKRRGPDKHPGTRQRSCKRRASEAEPSAASPQAKKRRKIEDDHDGDLLSFDEREGVVNGARRPLLASASPIPHTARGPQAPPLVLDTPAQTRGTTAPGSIYPKDARSPLSQHSPLYTYDAIDPSRFSTRADTRMQHQNEYRCVPTVFPPEIEVPGGAWWDILLSRYPSTREAAPYQAIRNDLQFLLENTGYWLIFFDRNTFVDRLDNADFRASIEPSLVLSALALSNLMQSSELGRGEAGRNLAVGLRNAAQSSMDAACNAGRIHYTLAEAAIILALFESSCHPEHSPKRANEALLYVDRIIRVLSLSMVDGGDPGVCVYQQRSIPIVYHEERDYRTPSRCKCVPSAPNNTTNPPHYTVSWSFNPPWDPSWTEAECRKEEWRRVTWSALNLIASYTAQSAAFHEEPMEMFLTEPANYLLLFPGEAYERQPHKRIPGQSPKDSVWALYCRSMLIWLSCLPRRDGSWSTDARAEFAINAWHELSAVQSALDMHHCNLDTSIMYVTREYLYNTRMAIADEFRRLQDDDLVFAGPMFNVRQAQEWVDYQAKVAQRARDGIVRVTEMPGKLHTSRPFQATWYMTQVAFCIVLWETEPSMINSLELANTFFVILDALNALWPCRAQTQRLAELRATLSEACNKAGISPPEITTFPGLANHRS